MNEKFAQNGRNDPYPPVNDRYPAAAPLAPKRPGAVTGAAATLLVIAVLGILAILARVGATDRMAPMDSAEALGYMTASIGALIGCVLGFISGILLLTARSRAVPILATVAAAFLAFTCIGLIATVAIPILLWGSKASKDWFAPAPVAPTSGPPGWYGPQS